MSSLAAVYQRLSRSAWLCTKLAYQLWPQKHNYNGTALRKYVLSVLSLIVTIGFVYINNMDTNMKISHLYILLYTQKNVLKIGKADEVRKRIDSLRYHWVSLTNYKNF